MAGEIDSAVASTSSENQETKEKKNEEMDVLNEENDKKKNGEVNEESSLRTRKRTHKQKTRLLPQKDVYKSAQQLDFTYVS